MKRNLLSQYILIVSLCGGFNVAYGQVLSPSAEMQLLQRSAGQTPLRIVGKNKAVKEADPTTAGAYIYLDDHRTVEALTALGVKVRHDYGGFVTATVPVDNLKAISEIEGVAYVTLGSDVNLLNDYAREHAGVDYVHANTDNVLPSSFTGEGVVVGLIDTGVEYGHLAFRDTDGNTLRIKAVWDQTYNRGMAPAGFDYGSEYRTQDEILGCTYDTATELHGSHTMGIAAGSDMKSKYYGVAPGADIVFVSFGEDDCCIPDAIEYIFNYADSVGKPCVINMSIGQHIGPHNGTSTLDRFIDTVTGPGRIIVGAAGNEGAVKLHATETFTEEDTQLKTMLTFAPSVDHKLHYLDIWGTEGSHLKVSLCVAQSLKGNIVDRTNVYTTEMPGASVIKAWDINSTGADATVIITGEINPLNNQPHVMVNCSATSLADGRVLGVIVDGEPGETVHLWNYSGHEFSSNGKSGWTDGTTAGTVGEIGGTANSIITVGSYDARPRIDWLSGGYSLMGDNSDFDADHRSSFSSCGPTADGRSVPVVLAPGNPVVSAVNRHFFTMAGVPIEYYTSGVSTGPDGVKSYYGYQIGTSMSAPFVAGTVALMLQANPGLTPQLAKDILRSTAKSEEFMGILPNNEYGAGLVNVLECVKETVRLTGMDTPEADLKGKLDVVKAWTEGTQLIIAIPDLHEQATATVWSVTGAKVANVTLSSALTSIDTAAWGHGVYVVAVDNGDFSQSLKIAL